MERGVLLLTNLVLCFGLVVSYPPVEREGNFEPPLVGVADRSPELPQPSQNVNYNGNAEGILLPSPSDSLQRNQNQQLDFGPQRANIMPKTYYQGQPLPQVPFDRNLNKGPFVPWQREQTEFGIQTANNIPKKYNRGIQLAQPFEQRFTNQNYNNFGVPQDGFNNVPQNIPEIQPRAYRNTQPSPVSAPQNNNIVQPGDQRFPQNEIFQKPRNTLLDPVSNVDPRRDYVNNQNSYPQYQMPAPIISNPVDNYNNYFRQERPMQNQYQQMPMPIPGRFQQWPGTGYQNLPPWDPQYNRQAYPGYSHDNVSTLNVEPVSDSPEQNFQNDQTQIVPTQQPVTDNPKHQKRYIIVYTNGTYDHVDKLDGIVKDDAQLTSKDVPNHIMAIIEVEDDESEKEKEKSSELPFDTGISNIPHDTNNKWNPSFQDNSGTLRNHANPVVLRTELHKPIPNINTTTENTDTDYFKPEYIMPIQSTTVNSVDNSTDKELITTDTNVDETTDNVAKLSITVTPSKDKKKTSGDIISDGVEHITKPSEEDPTSFEGNNQIYGDNVPGRMYQRAIPTSISKTRDKSDGYSPRVLDEDDSTRKAPNDQEKIRPSTYMFDMPDLFGNSVPEETTISVAEDQKGEDKTKPTDASSTKNKFDIPQDALKSVLTIPDMDDLKAVVDKPIVWFRPDENFWDKVAKQDQSYDVVSIYDVRCVPKLIEKRSTVHHYPNGTEIIDYVETLWNHANDINPTKIKSNRVVKYPD